MSAASSERPPSACWLRSASAAMPPITTTQYRSMTERASEPFSIDSPSSGSKNTVPAAPLTRPSRSAATGSSRQAWTGQPSR